MRIIVLFILLVNIFSVKAQKLFDEKFSDCPVKFILEDEEFMINYETGDSMMVVDFLSGIEEKQVERMAGVVMMQVMIDTAQQVWCVSYTNKCTLNNKRLDISDRLKAMPGWKRANNEFDSDNICALISIIFDKKEITVIRTGYNRNRGRRILQTEKFKRYKEPVPVNKLK